MTYQHKFKVGDTVTHDFSKLEGEVIATRLVSSGYDYKVRWLNYMEADWYQESVLLPYEPPTKAQASPPRPSLAEGKNG